MGAFTAGQELRSLGSNFLTHPVAGSLVWTSLSIPSPSGGRGSARRHSTEQGSLVCPSSGGILNVGGDLFVRLALVFGSDNN